MIKNPPEVGAVRIHMDPESLDTSFGGLTASTFQGVATLITPAGPFKMEGVRWHLISKVFSSPEDIKTDLYDSWSLSHMGYLYPRTTPVMIKLDHDRSCPWV